MEIVFKQSLIPLNHTSTSPVPFPLNRVDPPTSSESHVAHIRPQTELGMSEHVHDQPTQRNKKEKNVSMVGEGVS